MLGCRTCTWKEVNLWPKQIVESFFFSCLIIYFCLVWGCNLYFKKSVLGWTLWPKGFLKKNRRSILLKQMLNDFLGFSDPACTLPFNGTWVSSNRGTWTVSSSAIQNFKLNVDTTGSSLWTMDCYESDGTYYVLK